MSVIEERLTLPNTELKRLKVLEMIQNEQVTVATAAPVCTADAAIFDRRGLGAILPAPAHPATGA
jgi:hypothetical protein